MNTANAGKVSRAVIWLEYNFNPNNFRKKRVKSDVGDLSLINGRDLKRGVAGNFSAEEVAQLGKQIDAALVIPCHYEMFDCNMVSPAAFIRSAEQIGQKYGLWKCGEG